ncbi:hypothetical protein CEXT_331761 [Caerostris extrusa]|uniref:Uncharacterized protein n=1 Tax=Caerostris extrusa TaxID=172846 RepID=A0AAV4TD93_CAEEX|nr:hypothetical protein CEXT_331761 [Caerostris extrusa]
MPDDVDMDDPEKTKNTTFKKALMKRYLRSGSGSCAKYRLGGGCMCVGYCGAFSSWESSTPSHRSKRFQKNRHFYAHHLRATPYSFIEF